MELMFPVPPDAIRRQAHRVASSAGANGAGNYNPFARVHSKETPEDVESNLNRAQSETNVEPTIQEHRRLESQQGQEDFPAPPHAGTAPPVSPMSRPGHPEEHDFATTNANNQKESAEISDSTAVDHAGLSKRAKFKKHPRKDDDGIDETTELERAESKDLSLEERKKRAHKKKIPVGQQFRAVLLDSWINVLLIFVPVGFALYYSKKAGPVPIFIVNFIAIIPLAAMLSYATEELAIRVGETLGGLLNATFGNAVELIVSIQALIKHEVTIVKTSLIGSMLSNLLLVLGMSFFLGGMTRLEQFFNVTVAQTAASLLALCIASLIIPTVFHNMIADDNSQGAAQDAVKNSELSRGTAIILLFVYGCYLLFQLKSHVAMYNAPSQKVPKRKSSKVEEGAASKGIAAIGARTAAAMGGAANTKGQIFKNDEEEEEEDDIETPSLSVLGAVITLAFSTTLVAFCSEFMVSSIEGVTATGKVSTTFVGLILLPIVGNAAEHATAVTVAMKDKMDLAIGVAVGSSMQIALLVLPLIVVLGWIIGEECMTLYFDTFQIATLFVSVLLVNYLIQDGKSHWLEGVLLMSSYLIIALAAWFYPNVTDDQCSGST
ncbi:vacuolar calcium ion transporter-like protein /H(+) exchanger [Massarina eburnea CBS 473.64]|uniref:Vacuolar calcium ion transporter-like protein /H(+) exchanger n=1 Tax=Massarina eburnea CBS 473.64 TaxID=1395130 RepID=A0A6A6SCY1_9PLEO|nr:vacuolar calcium ion transporter-like protein /H(+) exchanger [Massarina eburnea CBS 473.64]